MLGAREGVESALCLPSLAMCVSGGLSLGAQDSGMLGAPRALLEQEE